MGDGRASPFQQNTHEVKCVNSENAFCLRLFVTVLTGLVWLSASPRALGQTQRKSATYSQNHWQTSSSPTTRSKAMTPHRNASSWHETMRSSPSADAVLSNFHSASDRDLDQLERASQQTRMPGSSLARAGTAPQVKQEHSAPINFTYKSPGGRSQ